MTRILVFYGTTDGHTAKIARFLSNGHRLAPARLSSVLDVEKPSPCGAADGTPRGSHTDSDDVGREPTLGRATDSRRTAEARHRGTIVS
jgi:hypothetical protein